MTPSSRTRTLAVVTNNRHKVFQRSVIAGAKHAAERRGFHVTVAETLVAGRGGASLPFKPEGIAGALVLTNALAEPVLGLLLEAGVPLTLVNHRADGLNIPAVMHNNRQGVDLLMEHLIVDCARTRPVFICGDRTQCDGFEREAAFRQGALRHGLTVPDEHFLRGDFEPAVAAASLKRFLARGVNFDAIIAADYLMAIATLEVLRSAGWAVPEKVAVVGFGDGPEAAAASLTTVAADIVELGRRGARQLIGQVEGLTIRGLTLLSTALIKRETSGGSSVR